MARRKQNGNGRHELGPGARVAVYCRDSGGAAQERSVGDQRKELDALAAARQWTVVAYYVDEARSGSDADNRPAFQEMIAACRQRPAPVAGVLVWSLSRFARDETDSAFYKADLRRHGVEIVSATDTIPDGPLSGIYEALVAWKDSQYLADLSVNVRRGHESLLSAGLVPGGRPPIGYLAEYVTIGQHRNGKPRLAPRWVVDPATAPLVRRVFELRADGQPIRTIWQQTRLLTTRQGFQHVLHNPVYKGVFVWGDREYQNVVPAIVSPTLWEQAQQRERYHPRRVGGNYLLSGLLRCAVCGYAMSGLSTHSVKPSGREYRHRYYYCASHGTRLDGCQQPAARADALELDVLQRVLSYLTPEVWAPILAAIRQRLATQDTAAELQRNEREATEIRQSISNLYRLVEKAYSVELENRLVTLRAQLAAVDARRQELTQRPALVDATEDELALFLADLRERLETGDIHTKREMLRRFIDKLTFGPAGLFIGWREP